MPRKKAPGKGRNTVEQRIEHAMNSGVRHDWPPEVSPDPRALLIFNKIQLERAHNDWAPFSLIEIARASKMIVAIEDETEKMEAEGAVVDDRTTPRFKVIVGLQGSVNANLRRLGLIGTAPPSPSRTNAKQRGQARREAEGTLEDGGGTWIGADGQRLSMI